MTEHNPTKILVVDDEPDLEHLIRQKFRRNVRSGEFALLFANDGVDALSKIADNSDIDVVLTDINMPEMDGLTLLSKLSDLDRLITAVVISAYGDMENIRLAMNRGSFDFLTKPIDLNDLEITVRKAIDVIKARREAEQARETFGRYVSDEVVNKLLSSPDALELGGEIRRVSLLMSDIRGFTTATQGLEPHTIVDVLNVFLGKMVEVIRTFGGTIDNFLGDGLLVVFGAPVSMDDDCFRAAACAVAMQQAMQDVNKEIESVGVRPLSMGIGIHTGDVIVGNIGSKFRMKYSVVGSNVNLVSRVESSTVGGQILVSEATKDELGDRITTARRLSFGMKGFAQDIDLYELTGVGHPYNLQLPSESVDPKTLATPLAADVHLLDGKSVSTDALPGRLLALNSSGALMKCGHKISVLSDLKLIVKDPGDQTSHAIYAKVVESKSDDSFVVRFTGLTPDDAERVETWINA